MSRLSNIILLLAACIAAPVAYAADPERIVITNAKLVGRDAAAQDVAINILIVDGKVLVVTKDKLVIEPGDIAVDSNGGFLFGELAVGARPSFVILDQDPRENVDALMDTKTHAQFAIRQGVIIKNNLPAKPPSPVDATPKQRLWKSYAPPPISIPIRYYDTRKFNKFETKPVSGLFIGALLLDRQSWLQQDGNSENQVGDLSDFESGEIRAARFGVVGTLNFKRPWRYTVFAMTQTFDRGFDIDTTDEFSFGDYRLDIPLSAGLTLSVGKQKEPISMERQMSLVNMPMQERTAFLDALLPSRNHGVILAGTAASDNVSWAVGAFNNWIDSGESFSDTPNVLVGRVTWAPKFFQNESNLFHVGLGLRHSDLKLPLKVGRQPEFDNAPRYVETDLFSADEQMTHSLETYWRNGPYMLGFEYVGTDVDSPQSGNPFLSGYSLTGSWALTGETRGYRKTSGTFNPLPVAQPVNQGGWGAVELAFRYSNTDLTDGTLEGGEMDILSLGVNWWFTRSTSLSVNYRYITLDRFGTQGDSSGLNARIMLMLD
ncbi:MAG: porin [Gammaproteobacteria bacterium]|nr:porin [Gammaproteobacteria bacterium]